MTEEETMKKLGAEMYRKVERGEWTMVQFLEACRLVAIKYRKAKGMNYSDLLKAGEV